jgi:hypothetical protein
MLLAITVLIVSLVYRWHYAVSLGGRLNIFLVPLFAYIGFVYCLSIFNISGWQDPAVISLTIRVCSLLIILVLGLINFLMGNFERHIRHELRRLGIPLEALA